MGMKIEFDVTLQCNFSCMNCNRHSNFNDLSSPLTGGKKNKVGLDLYDRTDVSIENTKKFIEEVKENGTVDRIHLIGGEPLVHPQMDKICDLIREELWGKYVREILIVSNIHPKMIKKGTLDNPEKIMKYLMTDYDVELPGNIYDFEHIGIPSTITLMMIKGILKGNKGFDKQTILEKADEIKFSHPHLSNFEETKKLMNSDGLVSLSDMFPLVYSFHGLPLVNYKPLSKKHIGHRCTLVAPYDTGQEMTETCDHPSRCGINYSFDGFYPCSNGSAIARLFKLDKYRKDKLPKSITEWDGIVDPDNGNYAGDNFTGVAHTKHESMWDLCKLCQVSAKNGLFERDHGRPISVSYREAMGLEGDKKKVAKHVMEGHKKKLPPNPDFGEGDGG